MSKNNLERLPAVRAVERNDVIPIMWLWLMAALFLHFVHQVVPASSHYSLRKFGSFSKLCHVVLNMFHLLFKLKELHCLLVILVKR